MRVSDEGQVQSDVETRSLRTSARVEIRYLQAADLDHVDVQFGVSVAGLFAEGDEGLEGALRVRVVSGEWWVVGGEWWVVGGGR